MKKTIAILLVAVLAVSSVFAGFSGKATVGLGYNWETKEYGFSNGTGFDVNVDLATAEAGNVAEGDIYAGIKATMGVKVANKASEGTKGSWIYDSNSETNGKYGLGLMLSLDEAYVAGANWKVAITGTQGATSYAKSFTTHKDAVKDAFGNKTTDEKDVADDVTGDYFSFNKAPGVTVEVAGFKASVGFNGSENETTEKEFKYTVDPAVEPVKTKKNVGKFFNYNLLVETPSYDFNGLSLQLAAGASRKLDNYVPAEKWGESSKISFLGEEAYVLPKFHHMAINTSAKAGYTTDALTVAVAADFDMIQYGEKETPTLSDKLYSYFDTSAKVSYAPVTVDAYYAFDGLTAKANEKEEAKIKLLAHKLSAQVATDLAAFDLPVKLTVWGKDVLNTMDFGAKAEVAIDAIKLSVNGGYIVDPLYTKKYNAVVTIGKYYLGADVEYKNDLFTAKSGVGFNSLVGKDSKDSSQLTIKASVETEAIIPGATLKLAYGADKKDQNILKDQTKTQNFGKVDAVCTIKF